MLPLCWQGCFSLGSGDHQLSARASLHGVREPGADTSHSWSPAEGWMRIGLCVPIGCVSVLVCASSGNVYSVSRKNRGFEQTLLLRGGTAFQHHGFTILLEISERKNATTLADDKSIVQQKKKKKKRKKKKAVGVENVGK